MCAEGTVVRGSGRRKQVRNQNGRVRGWALLPDPVEGQHAILGEALGVYAAVSPMFEDDRRRSPSFLPSLRISIFPLKYAPSATEIS